MSNAGRNMFSLAIVLSVLLQAGAAYPIAGQFGLEFAIDAPWRLEPVPAPGGGVTYGPIPITITFHDSIYDHHRDWLGQELFDLFGGPSLEKRHVGTLKDVEIYEGLDSRQRILTPLGPANMREIERKRWISTKQSEPPHELCRPHLGQDCRPLYDITDSHEWHAMFWYTPRRPVTPGSNIHLKVKLVTEYKGKERHWTNGLVVHAGEAPLPRFSSQWLYGDLHYHSQMTDNEGESAYSYRNVVRALGALGMDFLFTTEHASDSEQVDGGIGVGRCGGSITGRECPYVAAGVSYCKEDGQTRQCLLVSGKEARDLNQNRFTAAKQIIYGPDGANEAIARDLELGGFARYRAEGIVPQIFMGEEVDAMPEMSLAEYQEGKIAYGDRKTYAWPDVSDCLQKTPYQFCSKYHPTPLGPSPTCTNKPIHQLCRERFSSVQGFPPPPRYFTQDNQGMPVIDIQPEPSRQHLVYFPLSGLPDGNGFVSSRTRKYGGGSRPLDDVVREIESKGVTFLAHPLVSAKPGGASGPDIVPYSQLSLDMAWKSKAVLGLQFWNENDRLASKVDEGCSVPPFLALQAATQPAARQQVEVIMRPCRRVYEARLPDGGKSYTPVGAFLGMWAGGDASKPWSWRAPADQLKKYAQLYHGAFSWDRYLRKGLTPGETAQVSAWLPPGEPRKWFMAGGSDSHGDLNYRRYGEVCNAEWCESSVGDTAIGNPRNLVFVGLPTGPSVPGQPPGTKRRHTNSQVIEALKAGNFSVTDGPALRLAIDRNRDGKLTDGFDFPMGSTFNLFPQEQVPILIEWISSPEFGRVKKIDVYVGTKDRTYVPTGHGPQHTICRGSSDDNARDEYGNTICDEASGAYIPGWTVLQVDLTGVDPGLGYHGMAKIYLNPYHFGITLEDKRLFYVRAYAQTFGRTQQGGCTEAPLAPGKCGDRLAYSNPVWGRYHAVCDSARFASAGRQSIDFNNDGIPDTCQAPLPDPCPAPPPLTPKGGAAVAGGMVPSTGTLAEGQTGSGGVGATLRSCKIVTAVFGNLLGPTVVQPVPTATIMSRGLEQSEQPVESQEPDLLFIEVPEGSGGQKGGLQQTEPKDK